MQHNEILQINNELSELYLCENKIKEEIIKFKQNWTIRKYALINKNWIEKYKQYYNYEHFLKTYEIKFPSNIGNIFVFNNLIPEFDDRPLELINGKTNNNMDCSILKNFVLVSEEFIELIMKHF